MYLPPHLFVPPAPDLLGWTGRFGLQAGPGLDCFGGDPSPFQLDSPCPLVCPVTFCDSLFPTYYTSQTVAWVVPACLGWVVLVILEQTDGAVFLVDPGPWTPSPFPRPQLDWLIVDLPPYLLI